MKKQLIKSMLALSITAFAASMLAVSCGKTPAAGNNNNNNNANSGCTGICPTGKLTVTNSTPASLAWLKIKNNVVIISAGGLAAASTPLSDADDNNRGFVDDTGIVNLFQINYSEAPTAALSFVTLASVTKDTLAMPATKPNSCSGSESSDNTLAAKVEGGFCRIYDANDALKGITIGIESYLGTVFNNTKTTTHARGNMRCRHTLTQYPDADVTKTPVTITDATVFNTTSARGSCLISVINNAGTATAAKIDDAWVADAASVKEVELYALSIDVSGKTIPKFSDAAGYGLSEFIKAHDNAAIKRLLKNNKWAELKFKVRIVTAADFAAL